MMGISGTGSCIPVFSMVKGNHLESDDNLEYLEYVGNLLL